MNSCQNLLPLNQAESFRSDMDLLKVDINKEAIRNKAATHNKEDMDIIKVHRL